MTKLASLRGSVVSVHIELIQIWYLVKSVSLLQFNQTVVIGIRMMLGKIKVEWYDKCALHAHVIYFTVFKSSPAVMSFNRPQNIMDILEIQENGPEIIHQEYSS